MTTASAPSGPASPAAAAEAPPRVQTIGALAFAGDLTMGQPADHSPKTAWLAYSCGLAAGWPVEVAEAALPVALLRWSGCTANAQEFSELFGDDIEGRSNLVRGLSPFVRGMPAHPNLHAAIEPLARAHCEVAVAIVQRLGLPAAIQEAIADVLERWDGTGFPQGKRSESIHPAAQLVAWAGCVEVFVRIHGVHTGIAMTRRHAGRLFDPSLLRALDHHVAPVLATPGFESAWTSCAEVLAKQDFAPRAFGAPEMASLLSDYAELKVPRSTGAAALAARVAARASEGRLAPSLQSVVVQAASLHALGRVSVASTAIDRSRPTQPHDTESMRLHPYWAARILSRAPLLHREAALVMRAFERCDSSGFPFGVPTPADESALLLLQASVALAECVLPWLPIPPMALRDAQSHLLLLVERGQLDPRSVELVIAASAGRALPAVHGEADAEALVTPREREVLRHLCHGLSNKQIARELAISPKTVGTHIERIYAKLEVTTRAAATLKAMQFGLIA